MYLNFVDILRVTATFSNNKQLVRRYRVIFLTHDAHGDKVFSTGAKCHIDWRWEFLSPAIEQLMPKYKVLRGNFDAATLQESDSGSILTSSVIKDMVKALEPTNFEVAGEMYRVCGKIVEKYAQELEICDCHSKIWHSGFGRKRRKKEMNQAINKLTCVWQGRRLAWWIVCGMKEMV